MKNKTINTAMISKFAEQLTEEEKSDATVEKYLRDVAAFSEFLKDRELTKQEVMEYKRQITDTYAPASVNSMLVSVNSFLASIERADCRVKLLKIQRQMFINEKKELTAPEYRRLLKAARGTRLELVIQTICETGIRVSELRFITVEAVECGRAVVDCKNKTRVILIPTPLRKLLLQYIKRTGLKAGSVFVTKTGKPLNRSNIWRDMKALCEKADVDAEKVFPHNLRHLFAGTYFLLVKEGVLALPYNIIDEHDMEVFCLDDAELCDVASLDMYIEEWQAHSDELFGAMAAMRRMLKAEEERRAVPPGETAY